MEELAAKFNFKQGALAVFLCAITAIVTLYGSNSAREVGLRQSDTERIDKLFKQINEQQNQIARLMTMNAAQSLQIVNLQAEIQNKTNRMEMNQSFIDALPVSAWIKEHRDDGSFVMVMINQEYTSTFGITKRQYKGRTDYEIHPHKYALQYQQNDALVYDSKAPLHTIEDVYIKGKVVKYVVFKFLIEIRPGVYGIGGIAVRHDNIDMITK